MKMNHHLAIAVTLIVVVCAKQLNAQNIINDTVFVNATSQVTLKFPGKTKATLVEGDGSYEVASGTNDKTLLVKASRPDAKPSQALVVTDGDRKHEYVLLYREQIPTLLIDWSNTKKLKDYVNDRKKKTVARLTSAQGLMGSGRHAEAIQLFSRLVYDVDEQQRESVRAMLEQCESAMATTKKAQFEGFVSAAEGYVTGKQYRLADGEYRNALAVQDDSEVRNRWEKNKKAWCKWAADSAVKAAPKSLALAVYYYRESAEADSLEFARMYKGNSQATLARYNEQMHKTFEEIGDDAFELNELEKAKQAYDSSLAFKDHKRCRDRLVKTTELLSRKLDLMNKEQDYYRFLSTGKFLAAKAITEKDFAEAIAQYRKADAVFKDRRFPKAQIETLEKLQEGVVKKKL